MISKKRGRPQVEERRIPMGLRVTPQLRDELVKRAEATGRSITQQMEMLLEQALLLDKLLGRTGGWKLHGCVCPPTSEQTCKGPLCPRRSIGAAGFVTTDVAVDTAFLKE